MFKNYTIFQCHAPHGVASMYFGGLIYRFEGDYPDGTDQQIRRHLLTTSASDKIYTVPWTLQNAMEQARQYSMKLIVNMNEVIREDIPLVSQELFGKVAGILTGIILESGFTDETAAIALINEPAERWKLKVMEYVHYCYRANEQVGGRLPLILSNEEYHRWDEKILFEQTTNIPNRIFGVHHFSSLGYPPKWKNVKDAKTQANIWGIPIICNEGSSWFKDYQKAEGHAVNVWLMKECKELNYLGCGPCLVDINLDGKKDYKNLGYRIWDNKYTFIDKQNNWKEFQEELKKYWKGGEPVPEDRVIRIAVPPMKGGDVSLVEGKLQELGFDLKADGIYQYPDNETVKVFQRETKIVVDGVVGPQTKKKLKETTMDTFYPEVKKNIYESKGYSVELINYFLREYGHPNLRDHGLFYKQAEEETGLPAEWQLGMGMQESGEPDSTGRIILGNSYHGRENKNLYGWAITDSGPVAGYKFETYKDCIITVAHKIKDLFLNPDNWRYRGDHIFGIEVYYSTAPWNAINKAKWYRFVCALLDAGIKNRMPEFVEDLFKTLDARYELKDTG